MNKAGTGEHNEPANLGSLHVWGNREKQSAQGIKQCRTQGQGLTLEKHWLQKSVWGFRLLSAEQDFPVEHCSQKWKSTVASCTEEQQWKDTLCCSRKVALTGQDTLAWVYCNSVASSLVLVPRNKAENFEEIYWKYMKIVKKILHMVKQSGN